MQELVVRGRSETRELTVVDEERLYGVKRHIIRMICGVRLVRRALTDVLRDSVGVAVKIEDVIN